MELLQRTLRTTCQLEGKGLHTGAFSRIAIHPAAAGTGIVFDCGAVVVPALAGNLYSTRRSTSLGSEGHTAGTVEHLLSALTGLGVDNALIKLDGPEIPILDGSALPFVSAIQNAGTVEQELPRRFVRPSRVLEVNNPRNGAWIRISPAEEFSLELTIDFGRRAPGRQTVCYNYGTDYATQIAPCRTFCYLEEVLPQLLTGLARGGSLKNAIVIARKPLVPLKFPDECARHKLLDLLGDIRLCGGFPLARIEAYKPGHGLNCSAARELQLNSL